jgi:hypothetical protein
MTELDYENAVASIDFTPVDVEQSYKPGWWSDDRIKGTWQDTYVARQRVFPDGQCEVTVCKERFFVGPAITPKTRAKRGESENRDKNDDDAGRRAKKQVRLCCKTIGADRMVTLTYRENMVDRERALKDWKEFCRRLGRVKEFHYVAVIEEQERGALHFHVAVRGRQDYVTLRSVWQRIVGQDSEGRQMGQVNVRDPHRFGFGNKGAHKIASYIAKYCGKDMQSRDLNDKRYFRSRGIVVLESKTWRLPCTDMLGAVQAAFAALYGHSLAGLQSWCNNGLGVVYLATEPGFVDMTGDCPF